MSITGVHHTGIIVKNLDRSIYFYHDILGFEFQNEPSPWFEGEGLERGVGVPGGTLRQVCLMAGNDIVELVEYGNTPPGSEPAPQNRVGSMHVALRVDDAEKTKAELEAKGIVFLSDVNTVDEGVLAGWRWVYFHDPDGITVELVEVAYFLAEEREKGIAEYLANRPALVSL
jgi:catechol 2,3-dioxygenase-like lactoylglutathione lyase family enzyme